MTHPNNYSITDRPLQHRTAVLTTVMRRVELVTPETTQRVVDLSKIVEGIHLDGQYDSYGELVDDTTTGLPVQVIPPSRYSTLPSIVVVSTGMAGKLIEGWFGSAGVHDSTGNDELAEALPDHDIWKQKDVFIAGLQQLAVPDLAAVDDSLARTIDREDGMNKYPVLPGFEYEACKTWHITQREQFGYDVEPHTPRNRSHSRAHALTEPQGQQLVGLLERLADKSE